MENLDVKREIVIDEFHCPFCNTSKTIKTRSRKFHLFIELKKQKKLLSLGKTTEYEKLCKEWGERGWIADLKDAEK